ncbi:MAG: hypothetical protein JOZ27_05385 [Caulobacteraceae bacterium]|nr:hypothetical protein [Caulobacteraceae bacterium]
MTGGERLAGRAFAVALTYGAASLVIFVVVLLLKRVAGPELLREALGTIFITTLAAGLEPATARAAALAAPVEAIPVRALLVASALKAIVAAPVLALVWRFTDRAAPWSLLAWTPAVCLAGFWATDLRVLLDLKGRHAAAIWLKQGSLAGGLALFGALALARLPLWLALGAATLARIALAGWVAGALASGGGPEGPMARLLADRRWRDLAAVSVIAAAGGSADRILALRFLPPPVTASYVILFEVLSKFWFLPYVLAPVIFARRAAGAGGAAVSRGAWRLTALAGVAFVGAIVLVEGLAPGLVARLLGPNFGAWTVVFAAAVAVNALTQLRVADLQGIGETRRATLATLAGAIVSTLVFLFCVQRWGARGLLGAWLVKAVFELGVCFL